MQKLTLSSKKLQGSITLMYENDILKGFTNAFKKPLNTIQEAEIKRVLQFNFNKIDLDAFAAIGLEPTPEETSGGQRVALFCQAYKMHYSTNYLVSKKDGALLKQLSVNNEADFEQVLKTYFECTEWWASPKNIGGMVSRINELRQWMNTPKNSPNKWHFPNGYSKAREQECKTNEELQAYWKHLRDLGYKKTRVGITDTWKKMSLEQ